MNDVAMDMLMTEKTKEQIKKHEGYRGEIYLDSVAIPTGGYGHAFHVGSALPRSIWEDVFTYDYMIHADQANQLIVQRGYQDLNYARKAVLIDMVFNLGLGGVLNFKNTLALLDKRDFHAVSEALMNSKWARQVGSRAEHLTKQMLNGTWTIF
jgi:lysozyme